MSISLSQSCAISQEFDVSGGCTRSVFPAVDELLEDTDFQASLRYVTSKKNMEVYRSMVDFLFCEIFLQFKKECFRFYEEDGLPLRDTLTDKAKLQWFEEMLVRSLRLAHKVMSEKRDRRFRNWCFFRSEVLKLLAA
ncbi:MAG: hypothetical protein Q7S86_05030 [bacterium]|nr:hypothetical protein [bacterium]